MADDTTPPQTGTDSKEAWRARVMVLGQFTAYLLGRLGASPEEVHRWSSTWHTGDLVRMCAIQNEIIRKLKPPPGRRNGS